jgi:hypothetical protein
MALDYEQLLIFNELSEIIRWQNQCIERMKAFREKYPYLIPPNVAKLVEENLKENVQCLYRELNHLHKPASEKKRHVCRSCHGVFFVSLPGGLCDECRSKVAATPQPQYGRVAPPRVATPAAEQSEAAEEQQLPEAPLAPPSEHDDLAPKEDD